MKNLTQEIQGSYSKAAFYMMTAIGLFLIIGFLFAGCSDASNIAGSNTGITGNPDDNTTISTKVESTFDNPSASLNITEAKFLLRDVKFRRTDGTEGEVKVGPLVINLDLSGNVKVSISGKIPAGTFNRLRFKIHKVEDFETSPDPEFKEGTSGSQRFSLIAKGTYNGSSFVYKSRKSINMELALQAPFTLEDGQEINVTLAIDPYQWFRGGSDFLDPRVEDNENDIDDNIKDAFRRVFLDNNLNG